LQKKQVTELGTSRGCYGRMNKEEMKAVKSVLHTGIRVVDDTDWEPDQLQLDVWSMPDEICDLLLSKHKDYGPQNISQAPGGAI